jgi:hypothetical protein
MTVLCEQQDTHEEIIAKRRHKTVLYALARLSLPTLSTFLLCPDLAILAERKNLCTCSVPKPPSAFSLKALPAMSQTIASAPLDVTFRPFPR